MSLSKYSSSAKARSVFSHHAPISLAIFDQRPRNVVGADVVLAPALMSRELVMSHRSI